MDLARIDTTLSALSEALTEVDAVAWERAWTEYMHALKVWDKRPEAKGGSRQAFLRNTKEIERRKEFVQKTWEKLRDMDPEGIKSIAPTPF